MANKFSEKPDFEKSDSEKLADIDFASRRKQRKQKLRNEFFINRAPALKNGWRFLVSVGFLGSGIWLASLPIWNLTSSSQIQIQGARLLSANQLKSKIYIDYPKYIFRMQPQAISAQLEKKAPVYNVVVKRSLFPLKVTVFVQERQPVARAIYNAEPGFIDALGVWIAAKNYPPNFKPNYKESELVVLGINENVLQLWPKLYSQIRQRPKIKIYKLDFRAPSNLILTTSLGMVYCGTYTYAKMEKQLETLDRLKLLPQNSPSFTHIDLINPNFPAIDGVTPPVIKKP